MFVKRNPDGHIIALSKLPAEGFEEYVENHSGELADFNLSIQPTVPAQAREQLQSTDTDLVRVLEDVIDLLTMKGVIQFTDLPEAAQNKLLNRKKIRLDARDLNLLDDANNDDSILP